MIVVRRLIVADLPAALDIQAEAYPEFLRESEAAFASRIAMARSYCLAATRDGALVGYLLAHGWAGGAPPPVGAILPREAPSEVLYVHDLAVSSAGRGGGFGAALIKRAFSMAEADGLRRAELIAVEGAAGYWRGQGFVEEDITPKLAEKVTGYGASARWMARAIA